jgi:hypothetical protein
MRLHLLLAVCPLAGAGTLAAIESEVMAHCQRPLNLIGVSQPWQAQVKKARAVMAAAAHAWATITGHDSGPHTSGQLVTAGAGAAPR